MNEHHESNSESPGLIVVRSAHLMIAALALVPILVALVSGPVRTLSGELLAQNAASGGMNHSPESRLMFLVQSLAPTGPWLFVLAQSSLMTLVVLGVAVASKILDDSKNSSLRAAGLLVGLVEWVRWSPYISPDILANSLGILGVLLWLDMRRYPHEYQKTDLPALLLIVLWISAALLSGFWLLLSVPVLVELMLVVVVGWLGRLQVGRWLIVAFCFYVVAINLFLPWVVQRRVEQSREGRLLNRQIISGYPDFRIPDSSFGTEQADSRQSRSDVQLKTKVAVSRVLAELWQIRPFFSFKHNLWIVAVCLPVLGFGIVGFVRRAVYPEMLPIWYFGTTWILLVSQTGADWEGRLMSGTWPVVVLLANRELGRIQFGSLLKKGLVVLFVMGILGWILHRPALDRLGRWLVVDDRQKSDVIVVLVGGEPDRDKLAASLFHQGYAREIWVVNENDLPEEALNNDAGKMIRRLVAAGVPRDRITLLPSAWNTLEEAQRVGEHVLHMSRTERPKSITVVTTEFHSRRAWMLFRHELKFLGTELHVAASEDPALVLESWWLDSRTRYLYFQEAVMLIFTWLMII